MHFRRLFTLISFLGFVFSVQARAETCSYQTWDWDAVQQKSTHHQRIQKTKAELAVEERDARTGCTVCEEDQVEFRLAGLPPFKICKYIREPILQALQKTMEAKFSISSIVGYRVGKSKGPLNSSGHRTQFSNHSFGTAIDINSEKNGLYENCLEFGPSCRLVRGGIYKPDSEGAVRVDSVLYQNMKKIGFLWGGEIVGQQKDFMHFSSSGM